MDLIEIKQSVYNRHPWEQARLKVIFDIFSNYYFSENITILDVGCGDIYVAVEFVKKFKVKNYIAIDSAFDAPTIDMYSQKLKQEGIENIVLYKDIAEIKNSDFTKIDHIFLFDVIEHVENDNIFMRDLISFPCVTNETTIFITVPAFNYLFTSHDKFLKHYRRYNNKMIKILASEVNLQIIDSGYFFSVLLIPRFLKKIIEKFNKNTNNDGVGNWKRSKYIGDIVVIVLFVDYLFSKTFRQIGFSIPGLSKFIVCKKSA